jgi:hypothetical protein
MLEKFSKLLGYALLSLSFVLIISCTPKSPTTKNTNDTTHKIKDEKSGNVKSEFSKIRGFSGELDGEFIKIEIKEYNDDYNFILFTYSAVAEGLEHTNKKGKIYPDKMEIFLESFSKTNFKVQKTANGYSIQMNSSTLNSF